MAAYVRGIDLSRYQAGPNDFAALKRAGFVFVVQRWGVGGYRDPKRKAHLEAIIAAGLVPGAYFVPGEHIGSGTAQAKAFVAEVRAMFGDRPMLLALDAETSQAWGDPTARQCAEFCAEVRRLTGRVVLGYIPRWWMEAQGWTRDDVAAVARNAVWWQSQYRTNPDLSKPPTSGFLGWPLRLWQHSATGPAPGIPGNCDKNVFYGSRSELDLLATGGTDKPTTAEVPEEIDMFIADCQGKPALLVGPDGTQKLDTVQRKALVKGGVVAKPFTVEEHEALVKLGKARADLLNRAIDGVINLHAAVDSSGLRRALAAELDERAEPEPA